MDDTQGWPRNPVIYQIYPRSFQDSMNTGEGDLAGVVDRLPYVAELGVDAIWLSPFYASPMCDGGYDVADHCAVDPRFGTLEDFDRLIARAHDLGLRVMTDLVLNHTSDTHDWFARSLAREPGFEDLYVWADAKPDGSPPSNWISYFGQPAWHWHPRRRQYCLHKFLRCQPCLNHYNDRVGERLERITRFWRARGVDGFRYDAVTSFFHDCDLRDNPAATPGDAALIPGPASNPFTYQAHKYDALPQDCAEFSANLRDWAGPDAYLLAEINEGPRSIEVAGEFTKPGRLDAGYTVDLPERGVRQDVLRDILARKNGDAGLAWWLSSHDQPRIISNQGDGSARDARLFAAILCALPGPLILFQGDELGQPQTELTRDDLQDPYDKMFWPDPMGRDGARATMAWDDDLPQSGFSGARTWLPIAQPQDGAAATQAQNPKSVLSFYKNALATRRDLGLADGDLSLGEAPDGSILVYIETPKNRITLAANLGDEPWILPASETSGRRILCSAGAHDQGEGVLPTRTAAWWID